MSLPTTASRRIGWTVVAAALVAIGDHFFGPDAPADAVVTAVVNKRVATTVGDARSARSAATPVEARSGIEADLARLDRSQRTRVGTGEDTHDDDAGGSNPFAPVAWAAAPASAAPAAVAAPPSPPPAPVAPPFPYAYVGGLVDEGLRTLFFAKGERVLPVKAGDVVDAAFRIDEIDEKQMKLTYLPMNQSAVVVLRSP